MKKIISFFIFTLFLISAIFSENNKSLIEAAKNNDYISFEKLIEQGADIEEVNNKGLTLQCALAYFSVENFEKACKLLNSKNFDFNKTTVTGISLAYILSCSYSIDKLKILLQYKPNLNLLNSSDVRAIDSTQFGTFKFYSEQKIDKEMFNKAKETRKLLLKNNSPKFNKLPLSTYYFGNLQMCFFNCIYSLCPNLVLDQFNSPDLFIFNTLNGQDMATMSKQGIIDYIRDLGFDCEIKEYYDLDEILKQIQNTYFSDESYFVIVQTGNNPLLPYLWNNFIDFDFEDESEPKLDADTKINLFCPDQNYQFMEYQIKDITCFITIKFSPNK